MKNTIKKIISFILVLATLTSLAIPFTSVGASAASAQVTETKSISSVNIDTSKSYYVVKKSASVRTSTALLNFKYATLAKNTIVKISGSTGDYYKLKVNENNKDLTYYIKKSELKAAPKTSKVSFCYTVKSAAFRSAPYEKGTKIETVAKGSVLYVLGSLTNGHDNKWFVVMTQEGKLGYIFGDNVKTASKITLSVSGSPYISTGEAVSFKYSISPAGISGVKWSSSNTNLATVNKSGAITAKAGGDVKITASLGKLLSVSVNTNISLGVSVYFQSNSKCCSAASTIATLHYLGKATNLKDTDIFPSINGYVYKIRDTLNKYLGSGTYCWKTFKSLDSYEKAIRTSLARNSPVIARIGKFDKEYFTYSSNGHYTTIVGLYTDESGVKWVKCVDSFVNRYKSNSYSNSKTGVVYIPLETIYEYGSYNGNSDIYLIYNP